MTRLHYLLPEAVEKLIGKGSMSERLYNALGHLLSVQPEDLAEFSPEFQQLFALTMAPRVQDYTVALDTFENMSEEEAERRAADLRVLWREHYVPESD